MPESTRFDGLKLKALRKQRGWTQEQVAKLAGISVSHVSQLEKGSRKSPSVDLVYQLAEAFSVSIYALLQLDAPALAGVRYTIEAMTPIAAEEPDFWSKWRHALHPNMAAFLISDDSDTYLTFAKELYDSRHSSRRALQLVSEFMNQLGEHDSIIDPT